MRELRLVVLLTFLTGALHAQSPTVASVFRAGANGLGLNLYGSTSVSHSGGGAFVGTPAADPDSYVTISGQGFARTGNQIIFR